MALLQNAMTIFVLCCTGNPIWRPETRIRDWNFAFTKPCTKVTRLYILMRFSTVLMIRHSIVTFISTVDDVTSPTIQDGGRQTRSSPHCIAAAMLNFRYISMILQDSRYYIVTETPEIMVYYSTWSHVSTCYRSKVVTTSGFAAAILIYVHEYTKSWSHFNPIGSARLDYVEIGRKILVITATQAEIQTFPFLRHFGRHLGFAAERHGLQNRRHHH